MRPNSNKDCTKEILKPFILIEGQKERRDIFNPEMKIKDLDFRFIFNFRNF